MQDRRVIETVRSVLTSSFALDPLSRPLVDVCLFLADHAFFEREREEKTERQCVKHFFVSCLKSARSSCSPGPRGCKNEMLRVCLNDAEVLHLFFGAGEDFARASVSEAITEAFMATTMKALQKPDGGVHGIATGTTFRRLVLATLAADEQSSHSVVDRRHRNM